MTAAMATAAPSLALLAVMVVGSLLGAAAAPTSPSLPAAPTEALLHLQEVLGEQKPKEPASAERPPPPPEYMLQLYRRLSQPDGMLRAEPPYGARLVRSFVESDPTGADPRLLRFNVTGQQQSEQLLAAELRLLVLQPSTRPRPRAYPSQPRPPPPPHNYQLRVYQVLPGRRADAPPDEHQLLAVQYVETERRGRGGRWYVFNVKQAVLRWVSGAAPNLGLLVTTASLDGEPLAAGSVRLARHPTYERAHQPLLVLYESKPSPNENLPPGGLRYYEAEAIRKYRYAYENEEDDREPNPGPRRRRREAAADPEWEKWSDDSTAASQESPYDPLGNGMKGAVNNSGSTCARRDMIVDFETFGSSWGMYVIAPKFFNAYHCSGSCHYPMSSELLPIDHARIQSMVHQRDPKGDVAAPCCAPKKMSALSMLYMDEEFNVVYGIMGDIVVETCECR